MASALTDVGRADLAANGTAGKTLRVLAVTAVPGTPVTVATVTQAAAGEVTAAGYARQTLANVAVTVDSTNHVAVLGADTVTLGQIAAGATIVGVWVFRQVGGSPNDANDVPWVWLDTNDLASNGSSVQVTFPSGFAAV